MKKVISYLWPLEKKVPSAINGLLEITWVNGRKVLDSRNANYSYGTLQRLLAFGLSTVSLRSVSDILLLGLGGGCVIQTLKEKYRYPGRITAVEIDPVIIGIAEEEFGISGGHNVEIICADAFNYVEWCTRSFGLIIIDLFIDNKVAARCYSGTFWRNITRLTNTNGYVIFNAGMNLEEKDETDELMNSLKDCFHFRKYEQVEGANILLTGRRLN